MQFDELEVRWHQLEEKLDLSVALQSEIVRQSIIQPARRRIGRMVVVPMVDIVFCVLVLLWIGSFLGDNYQAWPVAIPAIVVMIGAAALMGASIYQLVAISALDWSQPVAQSQAKLGLIRIAKIRQFKWTMLCAPLVGFCVFIVGVHQMLDWLSGGEVRVIEKLDSRWIIGNYLFGILFIPLGYVLVGWMARRYGEHTVWRRILDDISGKNLKTANEELSRWSELQRK